MSAKLDVGDLPRHPGQVSLKIHVALRIRITKNSIATADERRCAPNQFINMSVRAEQVPSATIDASIYTTALIEYMTAEVR